MTSEYSATSTPEEASTIAQSKRPTPKHKFEGHEKGIRDFVFLHDNVHIVSGSWDGTMRKWNRDTNLLVGEPWTGDGGGIYALALSPDGKTIACGREGGSVQQWNIEGKTITGVWTGHSKSVRSLSWSPSGGHIASGSSDGKILIRKVQSGKVEVGPIKTGQDRVCALAYSPSGDRIASGGENKTICIWDTKTGKRVVGPIKNLGNWVTSLVWSSDSTKLYSASDEFARVFNSESGKLLHSFKHADLLNSVALSPKHDILACVGKNGIAQLWDTESLQLLGQPFREDREWLNCVSFSSDGQNLAYGGDDAALTLWFVKDVAPLSDGQSTHQQTRPNSPSLTSCLNADATGSGGIIEEWNDDPYNNFFQTSYQSLPLASSGSHHPRLFYARRFLNVFSRHRPPADEPIQKEHSKRKFFARRAPSNSSLELATTKPNRPVPEGRSGEGKGEQGENLGSANDLSARKDKDTQRDESPTDAQNPPSDHPTPHSDLDSKDDRNLWKRMMHAQGKDSDPKIDPAPKCPKVVPVYAVRGFQGYVALTRKNKNKSLAVMYSAPLVSPQPHASGSSPAGASLQGGSIQPSTLSQVASAQAGPSSYSMVGNSTQSLQATGGSSPHVSLSHFVTNYHTNRDSDSCSNIEGSCNRFLDKICFPFGRYHKDS